MNEDSHTEMLDSTDGGAQFKHLIKVLPTDRGRRQRAALDPNSVRRNADTQGLLVADVAGNLVMSIDDQRLRESFKARFRNAKVIDEQSILLVYDAEGGAIRKFHVLVDGNAGELIYVRPLL